MTHCNAGAADHPEHSAVASLAFDVTAAELVTAIVTERGVMLAPDNAKIRAFFQS